MHEIDWTPEKVSRLWSAYALYLDKNTYFGYHAGRYIIGFLGRFKFLRTARSILDFGCGPGHLFEQLLRSTRARLWGLAFSAASAEALRQRFSDSERFA